MTIITVGDFTFRISLSLRPKLNLSDKVVRVSLFFEYWSIKITLLLTSALQLMRKINDV